MGQGDDSFEDAGSAEDEQPSEDDGSFDDLTEESGTGENGDVSESEDGSDDDATATSSADQPEGDGSASSFDATAAADDPGPPYLFIDIYSEDCGPHPPWDKLAATSQYYGAIIKAWEGTNFNDGGWFENNWTALRDAGGDRYGRSWFRGAYLFLRFDQSGAEQADAYLNAIEQAGNWDSGDILPIIDVERGQDAHVNKQGKLVPAHPNFKAGAQQVIACATEAANRLRESTNRRVMLYGRGAMRDLGIKDRMGCDVVWNPAYTSPMVRHGLEAWELDDIVLWQYAGDNEGAYTKLPFTVDGFRQVDSNVFLKGAEKPTLEDVRERLLA